MNKDNKKSTNTDKKIGIAIQERRIALGISRHQLADKIAVTHQQLQKYEKGINRISIGRYYDICNALNVAINDPLLDDNNVAESVRDRLTIEMSRNFQKLNKKQQNATNKLIKSMINE